MATKALTLLLALCIIITTECDWVIILGEVGAQNQPPCTTLFAHK